MKFWVLVLASATGYALAGCIRRIILILLDLPEAPKVPKELVNARAEARMNAIRASERARAEARLDSARNALPTRPVPAGAKFHAGTEAIDIPPEVL